MRCYVGPEGRDEFLACPAGVPVVVDVLRATSTIVVALARGAARVVPLREYDEALALGRRSAGAVMIGERHGIRVDGFEFNNSPTLMMEVPLAGKTVVMVTTNGTQVMVEGALIASTLNAGAVAAAIASVPHAYLLASGAAPGYGEDGCAARLIELIAGQIRGGADEGSAVATTFLSEEGQALLDGIRRSRSGEKLAAYGYGEDVGLVCTALNRFPILPVYRDGEIRLSKRD